MMSEYKRMNDPVHGVIMLEPFLVKIIDTPEFQRLRHIKQLSGKYYVYPEAQHNRFEHSIGTAHLAGKLINHLRFEQPELNVTEKDVLCVKAAGLCHDLGHGPFSHLFEEHFLPKQGVAGWRHEMWSCHIFDRIIRKIDPSREILTDEDRCFVKELIHAGESKAAWTLKGRPEDKSYLYDIISNKTNGVDVDKWDYFARDCHHLGIQNGFDHNRLIQCTRVIKVTVANQKNRKRICFRDKEVLNLYEMFHIRLCLQKRAYQNKRGNALDLMISDALRAADPFLQIPALDGNQARMSECVQLKNLDCFCRLDDRILQKIEHSQGESLKISRDILWRVSIGDHYQCVGNRIFKGEDVGREKVIMEDSISKEIESMLPSEFRNKIRVIIITFNYGKGRHDPIEFCRFFSKGQRDTAKCIARQEVSTLLPSVFQEYWIQVFCTKEKLTKEEITTTINAFEKWYSHQQRQIDKDSVS